MKKPKYLDRIVNRDIDIEIITIIALALLILLISYITFYAQPTEAKKAINTLQNDIPLECTLLSNNKENIFLVDSKNWKLYKEGYFVNKITGRIIDASYCTKSASRRH